MCLSVVIVTVDENCKRYGLGGFPMRRQTIHIVYGDHMQLYTLTDIYVKLGQLYMLDNFLSERTAPPAPSPAQHSLRSSAVNIQKS